MNLSSLLHYTDQSHFALAPFARPFAWSPSQVTRLFDSLYRGFPIGEIVLWEPSTAAPVRAEQITSSAPTVIVHGAQRVTAIYSAIRGRKPSFSPENVVVNIPLRFHIVSEQFAAVAPIMEDNASWIDLTELFATKSPGIGKVLHRLLSCPPVGLSVADIAGRLNRVVGIGNRHLSVQYLPPEASEHDCREVFNLSHGNGAQ